MRRISLVFVAAIVGLGNCAPASFARTCGRIEGRLVDGNTGAPVVGAVVQVLETDDGTTTDSLGEFAIHNLEPDIYLLRISHLEYYVDYLSCDLRTVDSVLRIERRLLQRYSIVEDCLLCPDRYHGAIEGTILSAETGAPLTGATVFVVGTHSGATTNHDGSFQMGRVPPGRHTIMVSHVLYRTIELPEVEVRADSLVSLSCSLSPHDEAYFDSAVIVTTVSGPIIGSPIDTSESGDTTTELTSVFSPSDLVNKLKGIPTMTVVPVGAKSHSFRRPTFSLIPDGLITISHDFSGKGGRISGYLIDEKTGAPITGASILILGTTCGAISDSAGCFEIRYMYPCLCSVRITHQRYERVEIPDIGIDTGFSSNITLGMTVKHPNKPIVVKGEPDPRGYNPVQDSTVDTTQHKP